MIGLDISSKRADCEGGLTSFANAADVATMRGPQMPPNACSSVFAVAVAAFHSSHRFAWK